MIVIRTKTFDRSYKKLVKNQPKLRDEIENSLLLLSVDINNPKLRVHKLEGQMKNYKSCLCGYDCRIIFKIDEIDGEKVIFLLNIGTHNQVY